jgi:hypothetical protein
MIQLLTSLIEWLALAALSSVGIESVPTDCGAGIGQAEYRTISAVYTAGPTEAVITARFDDTALSGGCAEAATGLFRVDNTPVLITELPRSYDS